MARTCTRPFDHTSLRVSFFLEALGQLVPLTRFSHGFDHADPSVHPMSTPVASSTNASNGFTAADHIRTQVDAAVSKFYTQMNEVQVDLHGYEKIPNSDKTKKAEAAKKLTSGDGQGSWDKAAAIVQNLRELRDTLQNKESEAVYNYQMNDGVWKNGQALQDVDQHIADRQLRLDSARQLALQSEQQQRRQVKIKWLYVILFIVLLGAAAYMYMWSVGDEIGMHNAESVEEAVEAPEPSEAGESPGIMQTMGETLGLSSAADKPAEAPPQALPPSTEANSDNDVRGSLSDLFGGETGDDSSRSESSSSSDSTFS